jgi:hypothetical protein
MVLCNRKVGFTRSFFRSFGFCSLFFGLKDGEVERKVDRTQEVNLGLVIGSVAALFVIRTSH